MTETIAALLVLSPFLVGIPLLGKQLDVKHKLYDAARYSVWERTVWRSSGEGNRKSAADIELESQDRTLGDPRAKMLPVDSLRTRGITENPLWRDRRQQRLLDHRSHPGAFAVSQEDRSSPADVGDFLIPAIAHGEGPISGIAGALRVSDLNLNRGAFTTSSISVGVIPLLSQMAERSPFSLMHRGDGSSTQPQLVHRASGAVLSDTWSAARELDLRARVDDLTTNELIETLELPGRPIAMQALGKGKPLYGEGQFGWEPDLRPRSDALPQAYVARH